MYSHKNVIVHGKSGELSKIQEELDELRDSYENSTFVHTLIESADVIDATAKFLWAQYKFPLIIVFLLYLVRKPYKKVRNLILDFLGVPKSSFFD